MAEPGLQYKITVSGADQGAQEIDRLAKATEKAGGATDKAGKEAKGLGEALSSLGSRNNPAKDVLEGITTAASGSNGAVFGLTKAFKGFRELLNGGFAALGPGGILVAGLGVLIGLLPKFIELVKSLGESEEDLKKRTDEWVKAMAGLNAARLVNLKEQLKNIGEESDAARAKLGGLIEMAERIDNAQKAGELADLETSNASPTEKEAKKVEIERRYANQAKSRKIAELQGNVDISEKDYDATAAIASKNKAAMYQSISRIHELTDLKNSWEEYDKLMTWERLVAGKGDLGEKDEARLKALDVKIRGKKFDPAEMAQEMKNFEGLRDTYNSSEESRKAAEKKLSENRAALEREKFVQGKEAPEEAKVDRAKLLPLGKNVIKSATADAQRAQEASERGDFSAQSEASAAWKGDRRDLNAISEATRKIQSQKPLNAESIGQSVQKLEKEFESSQKSSQSSIDKTAKAIGDQAANIPKPLDLSLVADAQKNYHQTNLQKHQESQTAIDDLKRQMDILARQLSAMRSTSS